MEQIVSYAKKVREVIHQNPEIGFDCFKTSKLIIDELTKMGFKVYSGFSKTGVIGVLDNHKARTIGLRADMDALNIVEDTDLEYRSCNSYMHACGHDLHTAMLLGACKYLASIKETLDCNLKVIFQPAEEGPLPGGALGMLESHLLDDVDEFYALHVTNTLEVGQIGIKYGSVCASPDWFKLTIYGKGTHGCTPELGINPLVIASRLTLEYQELMARLNKEERCVISITSIEGGNTYNVIPDTSIIKGTMRTLTKNMRDKVAKKLEETATNIALEYNCKIDTEIMYAYPPVVNNDACCDYFKMCASKVLDKDSIKILEEPTMIGEDFAYYLVSKKGAFIWLGSKDPRWSITHHLHSPKIIFSDDTIEYGIKLLIELVRGFK